MSTKIWIHTKGISLCLRWNFEGKRYQLSLDVKDDPTGRSYAKIIAGTIERDLQYFNFDRILERYQNSNKRSRKHKPAEPSKLTAVDLFEQYAAAMIWDKGLAPGSIDIRRGLGVEAIRKGLRQGRTGLFTIPHGDIDGSIAGMVDRNLKYL